MFKDKTLLITGGTGSFGTTVLRKFKDLEFDEIRILSRDEKKQHDLRDKIQNPKIKFFLGDVRDSDSVNNAIRGVNYIFHAAALKQVPSCEFFPIEATKTNVLGTNNVLQSAILNGVEKVICLSTDKAAYPINAMGISKALMEKVAVANARDSKSTKICITRYGNVMASRGSVIPHFVNQIKTGQPITITDPGMTRFLMSLDEAVELVLYGFQNGESGDLFIQKSPASTIQDLSTAICELFDSKSKIEIIGKRHGEKMYETLATKEEMLKANDLPNYYKIPSDNRDLNYSEYFSEGQVVEHIEDYNSDNTERLNVEQIIDKLMTLDYIKSELRK
ncbi:polysaccharide biosynthesis protein [Verrucomicrobia bacterium]|nr:polysaccharide biosynthesis protein [Verrucomicrobiota bacterium]